MRDAGPNHGLVACGRDGISIGPARSVPHGAKPVLDVNSIEPSSRSLPVMTCGCRFRRTRIVNFVGSDASGCPANATRVWLSPMGRNGSLTCGSGQHAADLTG